MIRQAKKEDIGIIVKYIRDLAEYENALDQCLITEEKLNIQLIKTKNLKNNLSELQNEIQSLQGKLKESESSIQILKKEYKSTNHSNENIIFQVSFHY